MVLEKNLKCLGSKNPFLWSASLENSKQCEEDMQFLATVSSHLHEMYISTVVAVAFSSILTD